MPINYVPFSVIVPAFNEGASIRSVIADIVKYYPDAEVIVVDDGSTDQTVQQLDKIPVKIIRHPFNSGYGAAIKTGIKNSTHEIIVTVDADGQHYIKDIERFVMVIHDYDMIVGKRVGFVPTKLINRIGKAVLWVIASFMLGYRIPDVNSGFRVFKRSVLEKYWSFLPDTFSFHASSALVLLFHGHAIRYLPTMVRPRLGSSKVFFTSGLRSISALLRLFRFFCPERYMLLGILIFTTAVMPVAILLTRSYLMIFFCIAWCAPLVYYEKRTSNKHRLSSQISCL